MTSCDASRTVQCNIGNFDSFRLLSIKGIYFVIFGIISEFTDKGQSNLKGPQEGTYLYTKQFLSLR